MLLDRIFLNGPGLADAKAAREQNTLSSSSDTGAAIVVDLANFTAKSSFVGVHCWK